jgi:cellobiose phosphorylase
LNFSNRGNSTGRTASFVSPEEPIRAELFSVERLERTWYTGSAGWTYRAALERILGFRLQGDNLLLDPCIPKAWPGCQSRSGTAARATKIGVENPLGVCRGVLAIKLDGQMRKPA